MIDFKSLVDVSDIERLNYIITIEGYPVWDYKIGGHKSVFLISEDPWEGVESEYVTLRELKDYIIDCFIPFDIAEFKTEADKELLVSFKWNDETKELRLSHI